MRRAALQQMLAKYQPQVAQLFGVRNRQLTLDVQRLNNGNAAQASGETGAITFDRSFLRTADRADIRGALIHETTHALGVGYGKAKDEALADYARYTLNRHETPGWNPSAEVLAIAKRRDDMPAGTRGNGPGTGRDGRRKRNTGMNGMSKAPLLTPGQTQAYTSQSAAAVDAYGQAIAAIRAQGGAIRGQYKSSLADIRANRIAGAAETEGAAIERGIVGSSADLSGRAAVVADAASQRVDAQGARNAAIAGLRTDEMTAQTQLNSTLAQIQADKAAAQAELANQRFMQDMFSAQQQNYQSIYNDILKKLLGKGKNPNGTDPRAALEGHGSPPPPAAPVGYEGYAGQYGGKAQVGRGVYVPPVYSGLQRYTRGQL